MNRLSMSITGITLILSGLLFTACVPTDMIDKKVSSILLSQINLRKEQIANPTPERLEQMKSMGMRVDDLRIQRIFIYLAQKPSQSQVEELQAMGIVLYLDSWTPPVGAHPAGFLIADMPVDKLEKLAEKDYVIRLDTAERLLQPKSPAAFKVIAQ